ncbi:MAG: acyl dehydratase [Solirubrobacterales bacterium]|nr:acyl dehydratase [Solirubrobacterales bacterium]
MNPVPAQPVALAAGDALPVRTFGPLTRSDFARYAGAGGDFNPIHHDEPFARAAGVPTVFGMGLLHAGMLGIQLARWVGPDHVRDFAVRFTGQVWPGDTLTFSGTVDAVDPDGVATLTLLVVRQDGGVVLRATASAQAA